MTERKTYVYRLDVTYPEGSREIGWEPPGWDDLLVQSDRNWREGQTTNYLDPERPFSWPPERQFLSSGSASHRAYLLRLFGAKVEVVRSLPVEWPVETSAGER